MRRAVIQGKCDWPSCIGSSKHNKPKRKRSSDYLVEQISSKKTATEAIGNQNRFMQLQSGDEKYISNQEDEKTTGESVSERKMKTPAIVINDPQSTHETRLKIYNVIKSITKNVTLKITQSALNIYIIKFYLMYLIIIIILIIIISINYNIHLDPKTTVL